MNKYILALDQGTTSSRSILFDCTGKIKAVARREIKSQYPQPGWVEQDPFEIWKTQEESAREVMHHASIHGENIAAIGITNQRETTVVWNRKSGLPIHNAIVWQDRRTTDSCTRLKADGHESVFYKKTGLLLDPYFSGTKIKWILDNVDSARSQAERGELAFGTIDSWLVWKMTNGAKHLTDISNASRTLLFNIHTLQWDNELLELLNIPRALLPEVRPSSEIYAHSDPLFCATDAPISGIAGDQQAALFGQACFEAGTAKNTYGTGCFLLMNTGGKSVASKNKLLTTIAWQRNGKVNYALEGSVFIGGAVVQWLRDEMNIIKKATDIEALAAQVHDTGGVYFVPAFSGLGAPHWNPHARGTITGLTRGSGKAHLARAALESMCFQSMDVLKAMEKDSGAPMDALRVDGGACANNLLMQIQADLLQVPVQRPKQIETTAFGAAALAGLATGYWQNLEIISKHQEIERIFEPQIHADEAEARYAHWIRSVERSNDLKL